MTHTFSFEKLEVWQNAKKLTLVIYNDTKAFPSTEKFGLISQMRRAAISVASNVAEGTTRKTKADKAHFITMAYTSLMELVNQIIIALALKYLKEENYKQLRKDISLIANQLNKLQQYYLFSSN